MKPFQRFIHFLVMKNVVPQFGNRDTTSYMDLIYMDHIISRRLVNLPKVMMRHMSYVISVKDHELPYGSGEKFFDVEDEVRGSEEVSEDVPDMPAPAPVQQKDKALARVDPSAPTGSIPDPVMSKLQAEFERARANRIQADLEKAQAENARLLAILQQAHHNPNHRMSHHFS
ncbi:hypothetical protein Dimus_003640 [Dionaea muscipula]